MWMYNKNLKRDVFCAKVDCLFLYLDSVRHWSKTELYEVTFFDTEKDKWSLACLRNFEPPKEQH